MVVFTQTASQAHAAVPADKPSPHESNALVEALGPLIWPTDCRIVIPDVRAKILTALQPVITHDKRAFVDQVISDEFFHRCGWDRDSYTQKDHDCDTSGRCGFVLADAFEADDAHTADLLRWRIDHPQEHPTAWTKLYSYGTRMVWPPDLVAGIYDAWLSGCRKDWTTARSCFDLLCEGVARRSWVDAEARVALLSAEPLRTGYDVHDDDLSFIEKCIIHHSSSERGIPRYPDVARYLVRKAEVSPDPVTSNAFLTYQEVNTDVPEAQLLIITALRRWSTGTFSCHEYVDDLACGKDLIRQLKALATPEAAAALAELTPAIEARTDRLKSESRRGAVATAGSRAASASPLLLLSGLGVAQALAWRQSNAPSALRTPLATIDTAIVGGAAFVSVVVTMAYALSAHDTPSGLGTIDNAMSGIGPALISLSAGLVAGAASLYGAGYLGYRLRDNRTFYMSIAASEAVLPVLVFLYHVVTR